MEKAEYERFLVKCLKKDKLQILSNPYGFVRGIPSELAEDMLILAMEDAAKVTNPETLKRLKIICEFFINGKSKRRKSYDSDNSKIKVFKDKFTVYESQLRQIELRLKDF